MNPLLLILFALAFVLVGAQFERRIWTSHGQQPGPKAPLHRGKRRWVIVQDEAQPPPAPGRCYVALTLFSALWQWGRTDLMALLWRRFTFGLGKYGTLVQTHNGRDALVDARDELGDLLQYGTQAILEAHINGESEGNVPHDEQFDDIDVLLVEVEDAVNVLRAMRRTLSEEGLNALQVLPRDLTELLDVQQGAQPSMEGTPANGSA
ncbi:MAG: hypothetical protein ACE366_16360 [Bradymonadia bacterium]